MTPAELLLQARRTAGLTQAEVAARAGVHSSMISVYERGYRSPGINTLLRLLAATGHAVEIGLVPLDEVA